MQLLPLPISPPDPIPSPGLCASRGPQPPADPTQRTLLDVLLDGRSGKVSRSAEEAQRRRAEERVRTAAGYASHWNTTFLFRAGDAQAGT